MPTYEFRCPNGHEFEKFYSRISDSPSTLECPECGAEAERRISGGAGLLFKGSGFYLTDYGRNAHRKGGADAKPGGGEGGTKGGDGAGGGEKPAKKGDGGSSGSAGGGAAPAGGGAPGGGT